MPVIDVNVGLSLELMWLRTARLHYEDVRSRSLRQPQMFRC